MKFNILNFFLIIKLTVKMGPFKPIEFTFYKTRNTGTMKQSWKYAGKAFKSTER